MRADFLINVVGLAYGTLLIAAAFLDSRVTEALRIDALFIRKADDRTRPLNMIAGLIFAGYACYSLFLK